MKRVIKFHGDYFLNFYKTLDPGAKAKIQYVLELVKQVEKVPVKFLTSLGNEGLYEIRIEFESNIYRIFCCFDEGAMVILFNGFQKKSPKTPKKEIMKAKRIMEEYFNLKLKQK